MKLEKLNTNFQHAYQTLVDTVEELVVKEGNNLQQALNTAEEKLSEWGDFSKEEVQEISTKLKHDFQNLDESLNKARESYKEEFKQDSDYVTDSIWGKLLKIMDSNTSQLIAFEKNLEEQVKEISTNEHLTNHQEHTQWNSDHELWLAEIKLWKKQSIQAQSKLEEIEKAINHYSNMLDEHSQVVQAHEASDHQHEKDMANAERDSSSQVYEEADDKNVAIHQQEREEHNKHAELHISMKKQHSEIMSLVTKLYKKALPEAVK